MLKFKILQGMIRKFSPTQHYRQNVILFHETILLKELINFVVLIITESINMLQPIIKECFFFTSNLIHIFVLHANCQKIEKYLSHRC
jgi:hypothetical protein